MFTLTFYLCFHFSIFTFTFYPHFQNVPGYPGFHWTVPPSPECLASLLAGDARNSLSLFYPHFHFSIFTLTFHWTVTPSPESGFSLGRWWEIIRSGCRSIALQLSHCDIAFSSRFLQSVLIFANQKRRAFLHEIFLYTYYRVSFSTGREIMILCKVLNFHCKSLL